MTPEDIKKSLFAANNRSTCQAHDSNCNSSRKQFVVCLLTEGPAARAKPSDIEVGHIDVERGDELLK